MATIACLQQKFTRQYARAHTRLVPHTCLLSSKGGGQSKGGQGRATNMNRTAASGEVEPTIRRVASPPKQWCSRGSKCQLVLQNGMGVLKWEMMGDERRESKSHDNKFKGFERQVGFVYSIQGFGD